MWVLAQTQIHTDTQIHTCTYHKIVSVIKLSLKNTQYSEQGIETYSVSRAWEAATISLLGLAMAQEKAILAGAEADILARSGKSW